MDPDRAQTAGPKCKKLLEQSMGSMSLEQNLREMERTREAYWLRYPATSPIRLRWRAQTVRHCFHILPGETIFELGAGSGLWTDHLAAVLRGENPITAAVFNQDLIASAAKKGLVNTRFVHVVDLGSNLGSFDYVVGTAILSTIGTPKT